MINDMEEPADKTPPEVVKLTGFTLDDAHTRDMDDALSVKELEGGGYTVSVSIANVALTIEPGSELDLTARERVATRYFGTGNSPMLPRDLADGTLSLWPDRPKSVFVIEIGLDPQADVTGVRFYPGRLRSLAKLAYHEVPDILQDPKRPLHKEITTLSNIARVLLDKRRKAGAMALYDLNNGWVTTEEGFIRQLKDRKDTVGHILIQEFMILANSLVAEKMVRASVPFLYRNHTARLASPGRADLMRTIEEAMQGGVIANLEALRERTHLLMDKADYGPSLKGHYGLNLPAYTHFTSPIRRYADLLNHQQFRAWLKGGPLPYTQEQVEEIAAHINEVNRTEVAARSEYEKSKAEEGAKTKVTERQIDSLGAKDFERVVKVQARSKSSITQEWAMQAAKESAQEEGASGVIVQASRPTGEHLMTLPADVSQDAPDALVRNFAKRFVDERLPAVCVTVAMIESPETPNWRKIREILVDYLVRKPELASTVFAMAAQMYGPEWTPTFTTESHGPDHLKSFTVEASLKRGDNTFVVKYTDSPKKLAEQRAAVRLLAAIRGVSDLCFPALTKAAPAPPQAPTPKKSLLARGDVPDPISFLNEYAQSIGKPLPTFQVNVTGPSHVPTMTCVCTLLGKTTTGEAGSKQEAKRQAAKAMVAQLTLPE
jgi:ribonuclease R